MSLPVNTIDTHFENILASYLEEDKIKLSVLEEEMKKRWEAAFSCLLNFHSREQTVKVLMSQFGGISIATAYRDVNRALSLFGDITKSRKEGWRYVIFEYNQKLFQMATRDKNLETMGKCLDRMIKLADLDKEESPFNLEKLQAQNYTIQLPKALETVFMAMAKKGVMDFNNYQAQDVPFEEVKNGE
jgi:predicted DNA-binding transcriptional regulator YafY